MKQKLAAIISLIALTFIMTLASCAPISDSAIEDSSQITIKLPPIASYSIRALTEEQVSRLQRETTKYRVTFSGAGQTITREGDGTTFSATFPTGAQVGVTVYCLNTKGEVIVKTVTKNITISSGANSLSFKLSEDGEEIEVDQEDPSQPVPSAATNVSATDAENVGGSPNINGVYPVRITWSKPSNGDEPSGYHVYRSTKNDGTDFMRITESPVTALEYTDVDTTGTIKAGEYYYYRVLSLNELNQGANYSNIDSGYGALTHNQFLIEFNKTIKSSHKKITYMNKPGSTDKLGTETKNGAVSGTVYYNGQIAGLGARIIMTYTNYADSTVEEEQFVNDNVSKNKVPYFVLNGNSNTSADMSSNGTMDGTINISGMYSGSVGYDGIQIKGGQASDGTYRVSVQGFSPKDVAYSVID